MTHCLAYLSYIHTHKVGAMTCSYSLVWLYSPDDGDGVAYWNIV